MLAKAEKFKAVVEKMSKSATTEMKEHIPDWSVEKWQFLVFLNEALAPTITAISVCFNYESKRNSPTQALEGDSYPTQGIIIVVLHCLQKKLNELMSKAVGYNHLFLQDFKRVVDHIYNNLPEETYVALLLDPRYLH
jgi:hypothetical protein